jgi:transposase
MPRPPALPPEIKAAVVIDVVSGRLNLTDAARKAGVSAQAVANWRRQFIEAGIKGLAAAQPAGPADRRLHELNAEVLVLKMALAEAHLALKARRVHR